MSLADQPDNVKGVRWAHGGGFAITPDWVLDHPDLSDRAVRLFGILTRYCDKSGHDAFPSRRTLAERLRCVDSTLQSALTELQRAKAVTVIQRRRKDGSLTSSEYVLNQCPSLAEESDVPRPAEDQELEPLNEIAKSLTSPGPSVATQPTVLSDLQKVYDHWRTKRGRSRSNYDRMSDQRKAKIRCRLREFTADELCTAIDNIDFDPWDERAIHDDISVIFRSHDQVERFLEMRDTMSTLDKTPNGSKPAPNWRDLIVAHDNGQVAYA